MMDLSTPKILKPLKNARRSEFTAWSFTILLVTTLFFLPASGLVRVGGYIFAIFFFLSGLFMSLANWMSRASELRLMEDRIEFWNGIQEVQIGWERVKRVEVYAGRFNDKINIVSSESRVSFDTSIERIVNGKPVAQIGFMDGDEILETILAKSNFNQEDKQITQGYYYYSKE